MAKRRKKLYDAFPAKTEAKKAANSINLAAGVGPALGKQCPHGPGAVVRKLRSAQDGGRLKYGVYVNTSCKVY
jgi:hypothetical protein